MENSDFEFGGFIHDRDSVDPRAVCGDQRLSVYGLLVDRLGYERGKAVYKALQTNANLVAEQNDGKPGIVFDVDGGRFVSIIALS